MEIAKYELLQPPILGFQHFVPKFDKIEKVLLLRLHTLARDDLNSFTKNPAPLAIIYLSALIC